jgi:hypothetical protein
MNVHISNARYAALMDGPDLALTNDERAAGWHFCPEWDGLLVGPSMLEWDGCTCALAGKDSLS